jgi:hypothetical protein
MLVERVPAHRTLQRLAAAAAVVHLRHRITAAVAVVAKPVAAVVVDIKAADTSNR